jgi:hypothetical protein
MGKKIESRALESQHAWDIPDNYNKPVIGATEDLFCAFAAFEDSLGSAERSG